MMRVPILGPAHVWGDKKGVVNCAYIPETRITKKHLGVCYHTVHEASAQGIWKGVNNIVDCLTKILSGTAKENQVSKWMYRK